MPARDGTGPLGRGPMTGRGLGMCILGADTLRRGAMARMALRRNAALGVMPGIVRPVGGLGTGLGRGIVRGIGLAAALGVGYGLARAMSQRPGNRQRKETAKEIVRVPIEGPQVTSVDTSV